MGSNSAITFGSVLAALLERHGVSARELAERINVQPTLIHAWIRGTRTPRLRAPYLSALHTALDLTADEVATLEASQVTSLKSGPKEPSSARRKSPVTALLYPPEARYPFLPFPNQAPSVPRPDRTALRRSGLDDVEAVRSAALTLLREAKSLSPEGHTSPIVRTFAGTHDLFDDDLGWQALWSSTVRDLLGLGWHLAPIWTLERNPRRSIRLLSRLLEYLPHGRYEPYYTRRYGVMNPAIDYLFVPTRGVLTMFTDDTQRYGTATFTRDQHQLSVFSDYLGRVRKEALPLIASYPAKAGQRDAFLAEIGKADARPGDRFLIKDGPSAVTRPDSFYREGSNWLRSTEDAEGSIRRRKERAQSFLADMSAGRRYRDVCTQGGIRRMITGEYPRDDRERHPTFRPSREDLIDHLSELQRLLKAHERYELALIDDEETERLLPRFYWSTKGGKLLIESFFTNEKGEVSETDLLIEETSIVDAFVDAGAKVWDEIDATHKNRDWVSWWLGQQIEAVKVANR